MPFDVFRRHQRKLLAVLAILAMVAFTLDFSLFRKGAGGPGGANPVVVELYGRNVRRADLEAMRFQRARANRFMAALTGSPALFGPLNERAIVDAMILEHKADELHMPAGADVARRWLRSIPELRLTSDTFDRIYRENFADQITDEQLLIDIANQYRILQVADLPGRPLVTPLDIYQAYRDQYERVSADAVAFRVEDYASQVADPGDSELRKYFDRYKDVLPDKTKDTPGFKTPRRIRVEFVSADVDKLAAAYKAKLTEAELREAYKTRPNDFFAPAPELPAGLFAGAPGLTPSLIDPFREVRPQVEGRLAYERAQEEIGRKFADIRDETLAPFSAKYDSTVEDNKDAKETGKAEKELPAPGDIVKQAAAKAGLEYEITPPLDVSAAAEYGRIGNARQGTEPSPDARSFVDVFYAPRTPLFDPVDLSDITGRRFLAWKVAETPERVPTFAEARAEVLQAWKMDKARESARKDADAFAAKVREAGGDIKSAAGKRVVITTSPTARMTPGAMLDPFRPNPSRPSEIPEMPDAGDTLRDALFSLGPKSVVVEPNAPKTVYYVMTLHQNVPVDFAALYGPFGLRVGLQNEVYTKAAMKLHEEWLNRLRAEAGLKADWRPVDETRGIETASTE